MLFDSQTIRTALCGFISENLVADGVVVNSDTPFESLGLDSFSLIEIVMFIERKFGVQLPDAALNKSNMHSVATLTECVIEHLSKA